MAGGRPEQSRAGFPRSARRKTARLIDRCDFYGHEGRRQATGKNPGKAAPWIPPQPFSAPQFSECCLYTTNRRQILGLARSRLPTFTNLWISGISRLCLCGNVVVLYNESHRLSDKLLACEFVLDQDSRADTNSRKGTVCVSSVFAKVRLSGECSMPKPNHVSAKSGDVLLLAGTMKGAFILRSDQQRQQWEVGGPYFPGRAIYAFAYDDRKGRQRLWAAVNSPFWGSYLSSSDDFGKTWTEPEAYGVKFPEDADTSVKQIWQITMGRASPTRWTAALNPPLCSSRRMRARVGRWSRVFTITRIDRNGSRAAGASVCTQFFQILRMRTGCS